MEASFSDSSEGETVEVIPSNANKRPRARAGSESADSTAVEDVELIGTALRQARLSSSDTRSRARKDEQGPSSVSSGPTSEGGSIRAQQDALDDVAKHILFQCVPWGDMWMVDSGRYVVASYLPKIGSVTASDELGLEILSYVPRKSVPAFLTTAGHGQVTKRINETRRPKINMLRSHGELIFGDGFKSSWFLSGYPRGGEKVLSNLLGAVRENDGVTYAPIPPILYLDGNTKNARGIFLNPPVIRLLKMFLFGPSVLDENNPKVDAKCIPVQLGINRVTPGMIALAATLTQFLLSPDKDFQFEGKISKINYKQAFIKYKAFLSEDTSAVRSIISHYNREIFERQPRGPAPPEPGPTGDALASAFDQLRRDLYEDTTERVPPPLSPRRSSGQPEDCDKPIPTSPQLERHVSISVTSNVSHTVIASSRVSQTTDNNGPPTPERDAEECPPAPTSKTKTKTRKKKDKVPPKSSTTAKGSGSDADDDPPAAKKSGSGKRTKAPPADVASERALRSRK